MRPDDLAWITDHPTPMNLAHFLRSLPDRPGQAPPETRTRPPTPEEIARLEAQGNGAEEWGRVTVGPAFDPAGIRGSYFGGHCILDGAGITGALIVDSTIAEGARVHNATVRSAYLGHDAVVIQSVLGRDLPTPSPQSERASRFAIGLSVEPGVETGGRELRLHPDLVFPLAAAMVADSPRAAGGSGAAASRREYQALIDTLLDALPAFDTIVGAGAVVEGCGRVVSSIVGEAAQLLAAGAVEDATLLSTAEHPTRCASGAVVRSAVLQEAVTVETGAVVERTMLFETAHLERHAKVTESLIAPNTEIAEGEVTASVVGPFVGMHHQSLLIAALWPEGRGNIGYGANVGSNHTSRTADQEIRPGEGTFFGLGTSVKFPANFTEAPYSIIATGSTTLPQRVTLPFSLIATPMIDTAGTYPPGINQILPAWGLYANAYALFRNQRKFAARDRAHRHPPVGGIITPDLATALERAAAALAPALDTASAGHASTGEADAAPRRPAAADPAGVPPGAAGGAAHGPAGTSSHGASERRFLDAGTVSGLGKNFATRTDCERALEAYRRYARFFRLYLRLTAAAGQAPAVTGSAAPGPTPPDTGRGATGQAAPATPAAAVTAEEVAEFEELFETVYREAEQSREKDIARGRRIIDDYEAVRPALGQDDVLAWLRSEVGGLPARLRSA